MPKLGLHITTWRAVQFPKTLPMAQVGFVVGDKLLPFRFLSSVAKPHLAFITI